MTEEHDRQTKLIYSLIVAGKSADFTDQVMHRLIKGLCHLAKSTTQTPFEMLARLTEDQILALLRSARSGNYTKLARALRELVTAGLNLATCKPWELEEIHGIGPKTSRFFIMWCRPEESYAALDVHILRWLKAQGYDVPKSTPQSRTKYAEIERCFINEAHRRGKTPRELDEEIWVAGAGRTQTTPLPELSQ